MKVTHTIGIRAGVAVPVPPGTPGITVGMANVDWQVTEDGFLEAVVLTFTGVEVRCNENGAIQPTNPELQEEAYRVASFVSDRLFVQTAVDAISPDEVLLAAPAIAPENEDEENEFKAKYKSMWKSIKIGWAVHGRF